MFSIIIIMKVLIKHPVYVGVPNIIFNKMYVRTWILYQKRGSIGAHTHDIFFQEEIL